MEDCLFCQILDGSLEASLAYRDDRCAVIADLFAANEGHLLVVPIEHVARFADVPPEIAGHMMSVARDVVVALQASPIRCDGFNIALSDGTCAGQEIFHSHLHVIPRFKGDGIARAFFARDPEPWPREVLERVVEEVGSRMG